MSYRDPRACGPGSFGIAVQVGDECVDKVLSAVMR
jgi:hypothetical protein